MKGENLNKIKVSIVTVCFNAERVIRETLESVLNQDYDSFEYIVKDGKSTDKTLMIVQEYKPKFEEKRIPFIIISEEDNSIYEAMNIGIKKSSGTWLNFMNAGDVFYNSHVIKEVFEHKYDDVAVIFGNNIIEDQYGSGLNIANIKKIGKKMPFNHQAAFFRDEYIKKYMYDETIKIGADYDLVLKLFQAGYKFIYTNITISCYRLDGISSTKYVEVAKDRQMVRNLHGYKDNFIIAKGKIIEAYVKEWLEKKCPYFILRYLNYYYKKYIKKYDLEI